MYVYNYRIYDRYNRAVASLAVLADDDADWRPTDFSSNLFGCVTGIRFPNVTPGCQEVYRLHLDFSERFARVAHFLIRVK